MQLVYVYGCRQPQSPDVLLGGFPGGPSPDLRQWLSLASFGSGQTWDLSRADLFRVFSSVMQQEESQHPGTKEDFTFVAEVLKSIVSRVLEFGWFRISMLEISG